MSCLFRYKILFLDVLFPLDVQKIIFVDADQVNSRNIILLCVTLKMILMKTWIRNEPILFTDSKSRSSRVIRPGS